MEAGNRGALTGSWRYYQQLLESLKHADCNPEQIRQQIYNFRMQMQSIGARVKLPFEAGCNPHLQANLTIKSFLPRKLGIVSAASGRSISHHKQFPNNWHNRRPATFCFEGGIGTNDELWEVMCLLQCHKMPKIPIFIVGKEIHQEIDNSLDRMERNGTIDPEDRKLAIFCDNEVQAIEEYLKYYNLTATGTIAKALDERRENVSLEA